MSAPQPQPHAPIPVATMLTPIERRRVDAAGEGSYRALHRDSVAEVVQDIKSNRVRAVLVSVARCDPYARAAVAAMVREFPRVPTVALLSEIDRAAPEAMLSLGITGVRRVVDAREASGWRELRSCLVAARQDEMQRDALSALAVDLAGATRDCWLFFETLFSLPPSVNTVRELSRRMGVLPNTLMSRFFRARLPAPKRYLAHARLIRVAWLFENSGFSVANVADHLEYSSPQSFGRHVRTIMHMTAREFRDRFDGEGMLQHFREELVLPFLDELRTLRPLNAPWAVAMKRSLLH